jgi:UDP-N-acetylglucosamine/UDP-N-acetylgalactosamine 4-epimerase
LSPRSLGDAQVYNVGLGRDTTLNEMFRMIRLGLVGLQPSIAAAQPVYTHFRDGDIRRSGADITKITRHLQYEPMHSIAEGLGQALEWYVEHSAKSGLVEESRIAAVN